MEIDSIQFGHCPTPDEKVYPFFVFMKNKFELDDYFSDTEILKILCRKRALLAKKIHDNHFLRNIFLLQRIQTKISIINYSVFSLVENLGLDLG